MKCINTYHQSKMTAIWPIMSLTSSLSTTPRFVPVQPGCSVACRQTCLTLCASHLFPLPLGRPHRSSSPGCQPGSVCDPCTELASLLSLGCGKHSYVWGFTATMNHLKMYWFTVQETWGILQNIQMIFWSFDPSFFVSLPLGRNSSQQKWGTLQGTNKEM